MSEASAVISSATDHNALSTATDEVRWLFVDGARAFGGHEVMLLRWLEELSAQRSVKTYLLASARSQLHADARQHTQVLTLPERKRGRVMAEISDAVALARHALAVKPHLCIVAEGCLLNQPLFALVARLLGLKVIEYVPLVQTSVSMGFGSGRMRDAIVRYCYRRLLHGWITITREQADDFRAWANIRRPILTLPNTVARAIEATPSLSSRARAPGRLRLVVLGRIEAHQKGLDLLLEFTAANPQLGERYELTFVGAGPFEADIASRLTRDPALARWLSIQPWSPPLAAFESQDVLLLTSRYEGVPLVMLEAMALGIPVVAPDLPGTRAFLDAACLFPKGDLASAFERLDALLDVSQRARIAQRNRAAFERLASNTAFATAVKSLTHEIRALCGSKIRSA